MKQFIFTSIFILTCVFFSTKSSQAQVDLIINTTVDAGGVPLSDIPICEPFVYTVDYGIVSLTEDAINATIEIPLNGVEFIEHIPITDVTAVSVVGSPPNDYILIEFINPLTAGSSGAVDLNLQFPCGSTCDGTTASLQGTFLADNGDNSGVTSNPNDIGAQADGNNSVLDLSDIEFDLNNNRIKVDLDLNNSSQTDQENDLNNVTFTLTVPAGSTVFHCGREQAEVWVNPANCSISGNIVTWTVADIPYDYSPSDGIDDAWITLPSGISPGDPIALAAEMTATLGDGCGPITLTDSANTTFPSPNPVVDCGDGGLDGNNSDNEVMTPGYTGLNFDIEAQNDGNVILYDVCMIVSIDENMVDGITDIVVENYSGAGFGDLSPLPDVTISYATNLNSTFVTLGTVNTEDAPVPNPTLGAGEYITQLKWATDFLPPNAEFQPGFDFDILSTPRDGSSYTTMTYFDYLATGCGFSSENTCTCPVGISCLSFGTEVTASDTQGGAIASSTTCTTSKPLVERTVILKDEDKSLVNPPPVIVPGDTLTYEVTFAIDDGFMDVTDLIITDTLSTDLVYLGNVVFSSESGVPDPTVVVNGQTIVFDWSLNTPPDNIYPSADSQGQTTLTFTAQFDVVVKPGTPAGIVENCLSIVSAQGFPVGMSPSNDPCVQFPIPTIAEFTTVKWVLGSEDAKYTKFPDIGLTEAGQTGTYRFVMINNGNVDLQDILIFEIFPFIGDEAVSANFPRLTDWEPTITSDFYFLDNSNADPCLLTNSPIATPSNVNISYSTENNPCRTDLSPSYSPTGCTGPTWSPTIPTPFSDLNAALIDVGFLGAGDTLVFAIDFTAPLSAQPSEIAWNSFAQQATRADNSALLPVAEPNKVGIEVTLPSCSISNIGVARLDCTTPGEIQFILNPQGGSGTTYSVSSSSGTVSPSSSSYGQGTKYSLTGNSGGIVTITITDDSDPNCNDTFDIDTDACNYLCVSCAPVCTIVIDNVSPSSCNPSANTYSLDVTVDYIDPASGDIQIDLEGGASQTFTPDGSGTETFTLTGLSVSGATNIDVTASFVNDAGCRFVGVDLYDEPACIDPCNNPNCTQNNEYFLCSNGTDSIDLSVEAGATNIQWYDGDGNLLGSNTTMTFTNADIGNGTAGESQCFYYTADDIATCSGYTCCPVILTVEDCCPNNNCFGIQIIDN